jgi:phosphoglycolate phosphatase
MQTLPSETLFVGDSEVDMETANNAGIRFIGAGWGFRGRGGLLAAGATDIIDQPSELLAFVA